MCKINEKAGCDWKQDPKQYYEAIKYCKLKNNLPSKIPMRLWLPHNNSHNHPFLFFSDFIHNHQASLTINGVYLFNINNLQKFKTSRIQLL